MKALYDSENLYLAFVCADRNPGELRAVAETEKDVFASKDDALAVFLQPDETTPLYYQMAFNTQGIQFDQRVKGGQRDYEFHPSWQTAVAVADKYWTAEVKFPFQVFGLAGKGVVEAAGRYLDAVSMTRQLKGQGSRHRAAASITVYCEAIAVVVSESTGRVTIFDEGKIIAELDPVISTLRRTS